MFRKVYLKKILMVGQSKREPKDEITVLFENQQCYKQMKNWQRTLRHTKRRTCKNKEKLKRLRIENKMKFKDLKRPLYITVYQPDKIVVVFFHVKPRLHKCDAVHPTR